MNKIKILIGAIFAAGLLFGTQAARAIATDRWAGGESRSKSAGEWERQPCAGLRARNGRSGDWCRL